MIKKPLNKIAEVSPGLATAAAQANLSPQEKANMAAFTELRKTHDYLTTLPQNEAYRSFNALPTEYRDALNYVFDPKYQEEDKGFFKNFIGGAKSSLWYSTSTVIDFGKQIIGMETGREKKVSLGDVGSSLSGVTPIIGALKGTYAGAQKSGITTALGSALEVALRPQIKTVKQPYTAQKLAEIEGEGTYGTYGKFIYEGFKELLPGGRDALPTDNSKTWKKYWEQAADQENVFDRFEVEKVDKSTTPEMAFLGKILAKKGNFFDYWEEILADPKKLDIVNRYSSGKTEDKQVAEELGKIVTQYSNAKISPGRDLTRMLFGMFPFDAEKAIAGDGVAQGFFSAISGTVDATVTFVFDPVIVGGKVKRSTDAARFGLIKMGEDPRNLEKAWKNRNVRKYWDSLGNLFQKYQSGTIAQKADVLTRITERFPEISTDVALYMAPNIKDADTALKFFVSGDIVNDMMRGNAGIRRTPLIPRYSVSRSIKDWTKDAVGKGIGIERYRVGELPETIADIARVIEEGPNVWAEKLGFIEDTRVLAGRAGISEKFKGFVAKDRSVDAILDRAISRQLSISPKLDRMISLDDASSADQVYRLARTVIDKHNASVFRIAWIGATEGERLLMYKGLLKTMGVGMGFDLTENGRKFLDNIDVMSKELYSVNQSALNLDEFTRILRTTTAGDIAAPEGIRKIVDQVTETAGAEGIASRLAASTGAEMREMIADIKEIKDVKKGLLGRKKAGVTPEEAATIDSVVKELDKSLAIMGGMLYKTKMAKKEIKAVLEDVRPVELEVFNAAELDGAQYAVRAYQLSNKRYMPNLVDLRRFELKGNIFSSITGRVGESVISQKTVDVWSFLNLYPRLGLRTSIEEVGTYGLINGLNGVSEYISGRLISQQIRKATLPGGKKTIVGQREVEFSPLGLISRQVYKVMKTMYTREELIKFADDPEAMAIAVGRAVLNDRFKPEFLRTAKGARIAEYAEDFVRNNGQVVTDEINGAATRAEFKLDVAEQTASSLRQYGPSLTENPQIAQMLKDQKFQSVFSQIRYDRPEYLLNWYLDLQNTVGKKNIFGQIVFTNIARKEEEVIETLVKFIEGKGNTLAKRFALYKALGAEGFAKRIYVDSTNALRDYSGRLNLKLIEEIKVSGGISSFDFSQLAKYEEGFDKPKMVLGRELIPYQAGEAPQLIDRVMKNGYAWIGRQIALLDREPILYGNYVMYREQLLKRQSNLIESFIGDGISREAAELLVKNQVHEEALTLARMRTLSFVDNSDVRTNLAFNVRNFGRYYRATEDFWRRASRIAKYEPMAIQRLAILNQTFQHSGFVHKDSRGQLYFTYPGDDVLNTIMNNSLFERLGFPTYNPLPVNFGGYVKMLTPSLDPESAAPRIGGPLVSVPLIMLQNLPIIGDWIKDVEPILTGGRKDQAFWRKVAPINVQRMIDIVGSNELLTEQKASAAVQAMRLGISLGKGPKEGADINPFLDFAMKQAMNIMVLRFGLGLMAPASVQVFANKDVPKEMINAGAFSWDSEFIKLLETFAGDPEAYSKAYMRFVQFYPDKAVYGVSKTDTGTEASFQKTFEAADFVRNNKELVLNNKQAAAFFIPVNGTNDLSAYSYLKSEGFIKNKDLEDFLRQASVASGRQKYTIRKEFYDDAISNSDSVQGRKDLRNQWDIEKNAFMKQYPLLAAELGNVKAYKALKEEALNDLRNVVYNGRSPDKALGETFATMIYKYDEYQAGIDAIQGTSQSDADRKRMMKDDIREFLKVTAGENPNAVSLYWSLFDGLIGE